MQKYQKTLGIISGVIVVVLMIVPFFLYKNFTEGIDHIGYIGYFFASYVGFNMYLLPFLLDRLNPILLIIIGGVGLAIDEFFAWYAGHVSAELEEPKRFSRVHGKIHAFVERYGLWATFVLGLLPLIGPIYAISGFAAGHFKIPFYKFFLVNASGKMLRTAIIVGVLLKVV